ncbi:hypothetical protein DL770_000961 [Monosporascus sp. CRB-9-2]|nr:hypothetical protein DL770_000961 [Monosporascus sp. CRB-9-2]
MASQLVHLPEVERLSPACIRILGGNPGKFTLQGTNTYLIGRGPSRLLIDTGEGKPSWISALKRTLEEEKATVQKALITHWHHDHVGGIAQLLGHSPETVIYKCDPSGGQQVDIKDGQTFEVEGATLTAVHTPGHTTDHMAFVLREESALFTGDNVLGQGTAVFEDLGTYLESLARMENLVSGRAYPGHGPVLPEARAKISEYIQHRHQRETQVLQALGSAKEGCASSTGAERIDDWSSMELVKVIYRDVPENLHLPAQGGVIQILRKLRNEAKVILDGEDNWRLKDRSSL